MLRIIGGSFRNRPLKSPKGEQTRPTLAVMRKAAFDIVQSKIEGAHFLDLYAGSGAMGFEALSRGAASVTFVETHPMARRCIEENCRSLNVEDRCTVITYDVMLALKKLIKHDQHFDIIYADPPYAVAPNLLMQLLSVFDTSSLLNPNGILFLEEAVPATLKLIPFSSLRLLDTRRFSKSCLHQFFKF